VPNVEKPDKPTRAKLLFIDDERTLLRAYQRAFASEHDVVTADGGEQAIAILSERRDFDLIICDLLMPRVNGMDVHRWMQENHPELGDSFIFVSGGASQEHVQVFLRNQQNRVLWKPFDLAEIRRILAARRG
jgi:DNA-binding NtrC family response regulator